MKTILLLFFTFIGSTIQIWATDYSISIVGFTYSPNTLTINSGDKVTIEASTFHPLVQVDKATWEANGNTPLESGWGTKTTPYDFIPSNTDTIYFVCGVHYTMGMKGKIIVQGLIDINENSLEAENISFYPNPVSSSASLDINSDPDALIKVQLYDNTGKQIKDFDPGNNATGNFKQELNFAEIKNGTYFLVINENKKEYYKKIIVMK